MHYEFTSAALRALDAASRLAPPDAEGRWRLPELLLALACEEESRAGAMLAARQINANKVSLRWPALSLPVLSRGTSNDHFEPAPPNVISRNLRVMLRSIHARLGHLEPFVVATDHLLWGLLDAAGDVAEWLTEQGFVPRLLEAELLRAYGQDDSPLAGLDQNEGLTETGFLEMPEDDEPLMPAVQPATAWSLSQVQAVAPPSSELQMARSLSQGGDIAILRVLDAAGNRAREGLRVLEDYTRFVLDDKHLTNALKSLRHELVAALRVIPLGELLVARDTQSDVGVDLTTAAEQRRHGPAEIATANFKRVQESLRTLEEFGKLREAALGATIKQLRYRVYTLERAVRTTARRGALADARLYVLIDGGASEAEFCRLATQLVAADVDVLQLRDKRLDDRQLLSRARLLREITASGRTLLIVNDRPDLAVLAAADGVHVGQDELSVHAARSIVGTGCLVGVSTHTLAQARQAVLDGADYIGIGPTFPSTTKAFDNFIGVQVVADVCGEIRLPAFAIGGIDEQNLHQVLAARPCRARSATPAIRQRPPLASAKGCMQDDLRGRE